MTIWVEKGDERRFRDAVFDWQKAQNPGPLNQHHLVEGPPFGTSPSFVDVPEAALDYVRKQGIPFRTAPEGP